MLPDVDGTCDGSGGCSIRAHSICSGVHRSIVIATVFATVLMPVENFFCDFSNPFQISPAILIMVFDLQGPQPQDKNFVDLVSITTTCQLRVEAGLQFLVE